MVGNKVLLFSSSKGKVYENVDENYIEIFTNGVANYDGIIDSFTSTTKITYSSGLYQEWRSNGYFANYYDCYKCRDNAIKVAKKELGIA